MGVLNENDTLAYFAILGDLSLVLSSTVGFLKTLIFLTLSVISWPFQGAKKDIPRKTIMFSWRNLIWTPGGGGGKIVPLRFLQNTSKTV